MSRFEHQEHDCTDGLERQTYERPNFSVLALSVVTLGGSPGTGDSGADNEDLTGPNEVSPEDRLDDDWGYDY